jgi:predicted transcriptional regulator
VEYRATAGSTGGQLGHGDRQRAAIVELLKGGELSNTAIRDAVDGLNSSQAVLYQMHKLKDAGLVTWRKSDNNGRRGRYLWRLTETEETDAR